MRRPTLAHVHASRYKVTVFFGFAMGFDMEILPYFVIAGQLREKLADTASAWRKILADYTHGSVAADADLTLGPGNSGFMQV